MSNTYKSPRTVTTPEMYAAAFRDVQPVAIPTSSRLLGRIVRGKAPEDFQQLAADGRKLVFTMGSDGLSMLPGKPLRQALATIGLTSEYVQGRIDQGFSFKLAVFRAERNETLATWKNVLRLVMDCYPELESDIAAHASNLPSQVLPEDIEDINLAGPTHPDFMSLERYTQLPQEERVQSPLLLRRLLLHEVHLGVLFEGEGYTRIDEGGRGMMEHVIANRPVSELPDSVMIDLQ